MTQRESMVAAPLGFSPTSLAKLAALESALGSSIRGKPEVVRLSLVCLLARGHLLIEDVPGVGKTTLAQALARGRFELPPAAIHQRHAPQRRAGRHDLQRAFGTL